MFRHEVLISGFGGQGVAVAGRILGRSAVAAGLQATMLPSHGTETRGGYVRSQVVIADDDIDSPLVEKPDIFCALSQAAYTRFAQSAAQGVVLYDPETVATGPAPAARSTAVPARGIALESAGTALAANIVMLGVVLRRLNLFPADYAEQALRELMPRHAESNIRALRAGCAHCPHCAG
ncbi:MAG: 2-oxoacid:acceptor oxidoreductase family protein [Desulfovibrio sp.]|jgi:2-oxoglutarate ferredoxin oxidoreductase subunit gamma|nr:2-oxoacid:acceptor oxidoreductase family protein [Desulfovibrio sp.]